MIYEKSNNIIENKTGVFQKPIIPGDCPTFDDSPTYSRSIKRKATKYNYDYRIWHD